MTLRRRVDVTGEELGRESAEALAGGRLRREFVEDPKGFMLDRETFVREGAETFARLRYGDLDLSPIELDELEPLYTVDRGEGRELDPFRFEERAADDFISFWEKELGEHDNVDLEYAEQVLKKERSGTETGLQERFNLQPHSMEALDGDSDNPVYDAVVEEMVQTLYGQALNKPEGFKQEVEAFERVMKNYDTGVYSELLDNHHSYSVEHLTSKEEMMDAANSSGSCIRNSERYFEEYEEDEFSLISEVRKDGEAMGYLRNFVMEDENGDQFLAVDTIEIDHKSFEENQDVVKAAGMAAVQMMYDLELDYAVGSDARVRYGVRQAYGSSEKTVSGQKLGDTGIKSYTFSPSGTSGKSAYLLMENPG